MMLNRCAEHLLDWGYNRTLPHAPNLGRTAEGAISSHMPTTAARLGNDPKIPESGLSSF